MKKMVLVMAVGSAVLIGCGTSDDGSSFSEIDAATIERASKTANQGLTEMTEMLDAINEGDLNSAETSFRDARNHLNQAYGAADAIESDPLRAFYRKAGELRVEQLDLYEDLVDDLRTGNTDAIDALVDDEDEILAKQIKHLRSADPEELGFGNMTKKEFMTAISGAADDVLGEYAP